MLWRVLQRFSKAGSDSRYLTLALTSIKPIVVIKLTPSSCEHNPLLSGMVCPLITVLLATLNAVSLHKNIIKN